jgi:hypothetical protein
MKSLVRVIIPEAVRNRVESGDRGPQPGGKASIANPGGEVQLPALPALSALR